MKKKITEKERQEIKEVLNGLASYMRVKSLTQTEIARVLDVGSVATVNRWFRLKALPNKRHRRKIKKLIEKEK